MATEFGSTQRELLETGASTLYDAVVDEGRIAEDDPRIVARGAQREAFELLVDLGLLILDRDHRAYLPVDPTTVQARVVAPMGQEAAHLLEESSRWADAFGGLGQAYRRSPRLAASGHRDPRDRQHPPVPRRQPSTTPSTRS